MSDCTLIRDETRWSEYKKEWEDRFVDDYPNHAMTHSDEPKEFPFLVSSFWFRNSPGYCPTLVFRHAFVYYDSARDLVDEFNPVE